MAARHAPKEYAAEGGVEEMRWVEYKMEVDDLHAGLMVT